MEKSQKWLKLKRLIKGKNYYPTLNPTPMVASILVLSWWHQPWGKSYIKVEFPGNWMTKPRFLLGSFLQKVTEHNYNRFFNSMYDVQNRDVSMKQFASSMWGISWVVDFFPLSHCVFFTKIFLWLKPNFLFCNFQCSTTDNNRAHLNVSQDDKKKKGKAGKSGSGEGGRH